MSLVKSIALFILLLLIASCENNIQVINSIANPKDLPAQTAQDMEVLYSDFGRVKFKMTTKELLRFTNVERPYTRFPKGITVYLYDSAMQPEVVIKANYALYHENEKMWEAQNDVVAKNLKKNEQINTEELFWDQTRGIIYSGKFTRIVTADGVFIGEGGFESNESLTKWKLKSTKGSVNIKENETDEKNP
jgi:LPS export ABC transporter protein LptC